MRVRGISKRQRSVRPAGRRRQRGSMTLDAILALGIMAVAASNDQMGSMRRRDVNTMVATGQYMQGLQVGLNRYISVNFDSLAQGSGVAGVANQYAPTLQELQTNNYLPTGWTLNNPASLTFTVAITPTNCPGPTCQFPATITSSQYKDSQGNVRNDLLSYAVASAGLDAGQSLSANPGQYTSIRKTWAMPNGGAAAGSLMMRAGSYTNGYVDTSPFYKLDGSRKLTGTMQANGQSITGANAVSANSMTLPTGNSLKIGGAALYGDSVNIAMRAAPGGSAYAQDVNGNYVTLNAGSVNANGNLGVSGNTTVSGSVSVGSTVGTYQMNASYANIWGNQQVYGNHTVNGALIANNMVYLPALAWAGYGCSGNGITTDPTGKILSCQSGVWQAAGGTAQPFQVAGSGTCDWSAAVAQCPGGSKVLGGGYVLTWYNGSNFSHAPDASYPDSGNNRWIVNGSGTNQCFQSYAN